jgi:hypothetical protein
LFVNPNSRPGPSPHQGGWVMDNKAEAERFVGIDVAKDSVEVLSAPIS